MKNNGEIKIKPKLANRIYKLAEKSKKGVSYHLNKAVEEYVAEYDDLKEAVKRLKDVDDRVFSAAAFHAELVSQSKPA